MFDLTAKIKLHPRLDHAVEFEIIREQNVIENGVVVKATLEESVAEAKRKISSLFPDLSLDGVYVHIPNGR